MKKAQIRTKSLDRTLTRGVKIIKGRNCKMNNEWRTILKFVIISGTGWIMDFGIYSSLVAYAVFSPLYSNLISATIAITFVFFISIYKIFLKQRRFVLGGFFIYLIYQALSIFLFSYLIDMTSDFIMIHYLLASNISSILAKCIMTPVTLATNYLFMRFLIVKLLGTKEKDQ